MIHSILVTLFYAAFAIGALWGTWSTKGKRQVGVALFLCWVSSNVIFWTLPIYWRPQLFPILEVVFGLVAARAWKETISRVPLALIAMSILAVVMNAAFSIVGGSPASLYPYEVVLNIIFALQCVTTAAWGKVDELAGFTHFYRGDPTPGVAPEPARSQTSIDG